MKLHIARVEHCSIIKVIGYSQNSIALILRYTLLCFNFIRWSIKYVKSVITKKQKIIITDPKF